MATITEYYGIRGPVPFHDVEVAHDNKRYLDPHLIRLRAAPIPFANEAIQCLDSFFEMITSAVSSFDVSTRRHASATLQQFREPWETRLGMAERGFNGHGGAQEIGTRIWEAMIRDLDALIEVGVLKHLEHLPLFVQGVDNDITSDIATRIVFAPLAGFTGTMMERYPEFGAAPHATMSVERQVWDPEGLGWSTRRMRLPVTKGKPLLLVPNEWVGNRLLMSHTRYFETSVLSYVQSEQAAFFANGHVARTPKHVLKAQSGLERGRQTNLKITSRAQEAGCDLVCSFGDFVRDRFHSAHERQVA